MAEEDLTVKEIIQGLLRKEYANHRISLLQLLTNQFANETELDSQQVIMHPNNTVSSTKEIKESDNTTIAIASASTSVSARALLVDKETYRQLIRIVLEFTNSKKFSNDIVNSSLAVIINATIKLEYINFFLEFLEITPIENNLIAIKFHQAIEEYLSYNPQAENEEALLIPEFCWEEIDAYQHVGGILCNLCQHERGRKLLLHTNHGYMARIPAQVRSRNLIRRRGAVGCIRSCLFDQDYHWWILNEVKVLTPLLIPLTVPTPFTEQDKEGMDPTIWLQAENPDKKYESDLSIMKMIIECLILLCQRRGIREELRKRKVYPVMRNLDLKIEDEEVTSAIYEVVNFLIGDEDPNVPIDKEDSIPS